jgi:hypothetical protein
VALVVRVCWVVVKGGYEIVLLVVGSMLEVVELGEVIVADDVVVA